MQDNKDDNNNLIGKKAGRVFVGFWLVIFVIAIIAKFVIFSTPPGETVIFSKEIVTKALIYFGVAGIISWLIQHEIKKK